MDSTHQGCSCKNMCALLTSDKQPKNCVTSNSPALVEKCRKEYRRKQSFARRVWQAFTGLVGSGGAQRSRLEHIMEFSNSMGYKRIGLAGCAKYLSTMHMVANLLKMHGFLSCVVACKVGGNKFSTIGIEKDSEWILCNPLGQAEYLNEFESDLNVEFGLCMGHDLIFKHYSTAPVTTLIVKEKISNDNIMKTLKKIKYGKQCINPFYINKI